MQKFSDNVQIWEKQEGSYIGSTYEDVRKSVHAFAAGLMELGIARGDRVALISEGRKEWVIAELGILYCGAINVPLSIKIEEPADLEFRLSHAECSAVIVSRVRLSTIRALKSRLPLVKHLILFDAEVGEMPGERSVASIMREGEAWLKANRELFAQRWRTVTESDPANICYTSGTVADPKGIVLTHRNYTANIAQSTAMYPLPPTAVTLLLLPWDHAFAHTCGIYALSSTGGAFACVQQGKSPLETLRNVPANIREVRPTLLLSVPALAKNFKKGIEGAIRNKGRLPATLFRWGLRVQMIYNADGWNRGNGWKALLKPVLTLFDHILFKKIRENFGGRLEYFIGGGALLDIDLQRFFYAIGIPMYQGYGLTEAAPVISANTPRHHKLGSSGRIVPDLEVKICDESGNALPPGRGGEIVVRGENVMAGYWKNETATAAAVRNGWLYTGDLGYLDAEGYLYVLGREKSLLIGHDGEKYSPEGIEETIIDGSAYIDQMVLHNSQSPYTVALLVPNREGLRQWAAENGRGMNDAQTHRDLLFLLETEVDEYRPGGKRSGLFPERWLPAAIGVLDEPFTEQNRLLNSTLKVVRGRIETTYRDRLEHLHSPSGKSIVNEKNLESISRLLLTG